MPKPKIILQVEVSGDLPLITVTIKGNLAGLAQLGEALDVAASSASGKMTMKEQGEALIVIERLKESNER